MTRLAAGVVGRVVRKTRERGLCRQAVDWYPWGEEAFAETRRRDVPLLISIGYAACHWCHLMG